MKVGESKRLDLSLYYRVNKKKLRCPFCGYEMEFYYYYSYDSPVKQWACHACGCILEDKVSYSEEELKAKRMQRRRELKKAIAEFEAYVQKLKEQLAQWGKYMSPEEKVKLLAEALEE